MLKWFVQKKTVILFLDRPQQNTPCGSSARNRTFPILSRQLKKNCQLCTFISLIGGLSRIQEYFTYGARKPHRARGKTTINLIVTYVVSVHTFFAERVAFALSSAWHVGVLFF